MSRPTRTAIARDTLRICEQGFYEFDDARVSVADEIAAAVRGTVTFLPDDLTRLLDAELALCNAGDTADAAPETVIEFVQETTLAALYRLDEQLGDKRIAVLSFASAKNPGGGFMGGASAQEESLARSSALYPCIQPSEMYSINRRDNRALVYNDVAVYSPAVPFFKNDDGDLIDEPVLAGVLTMPAPNGGAARRGVAPFDLQSAIERRVFAVLAIAAARGHTTLVLGAWGCGVFRNDVGTMARAFRRALDAFAGRFRHVSFSITGDNFAPFRDVFQQAPAADAAPAPPIRFAALSAGRSR